MGVTGLVGWAGLVTLAILVTKWDIWTWVNAWETHLNN